MRHHYPNPDAVPYASTLPPTFPCQLTTDSFGKTYPMHNHGAWLNATGDGNTDVDAGHFHRVRGFKVLPDQSDGHTHELTTLPCTAGAARPTGRNGPLQGSETALLASGPVEIMGSPPAIPRWVAIVGGLALAGIVIGTIVYFVRKDDE